MGFRNIILSLFILLAATGCKKSISIEILHSDEPTPILLSASATNHTTTKAYIEKWNDTKVNIFGLKQNNGIYDLFDGFVTVDDVGKSKNHPDIYLEAARIMGAKPEETAVFEDVLQGIETAASVGFFTVAVKEETSSQNEEIIKEKSHVFIESFEKI